MRLKNAITMDGDIGKCWLAVYRAPLAQLKALVPEPLEIVSRQGFGFINIVLCELNHMRPAGLPAFLGISYHHIGYRVHVRFRPTKDQVIEGLYFVRSDADSSLIATAGNVLTDFQFHRADIAIQETREAVDIEVRSPTAPLRLSLDRNRPAKLPEGSPFETLQEAERELKYKPFAFFVHPDRVDVLQIGRDESTWKSRLVHIEHAEIEFLRPFDAIPEVCYEVEPIHYRWNRGVSYKVGQA